MSAETTYDFVLADVKCTPFCCWNSARTWRRWRRFSRQKTHDGLQTQGRQLHHGHPRLQKEVRGPREVSVRLAEEVWRVRHSGKAFAVMMQHVC